jgi:hypothetical protein
VDLRRRCPWLLAQVGRVVGAGVEKGLRLAPLERVDARFAVQVPSQKPHLRPKHCGLAPQGSFVGRSESRGTAWITSRIVSALPDVPVHGAENVQDAYCAFRHAGARRRKRFLGGDDLWGGSGILGDLLSVQRKMNGSDILLTDK